jgi:hypothetical protein
MEPERKEHKYLGVLITILVMILLTAGSVAGTWYYMNQQAKKTSDDNAAQVASLQKKITELNKETSTESATTTRTTPTITKTGSDAAKDFCNTVKSGYIAYGITYQEGDSAEFVSCSMGAASGAGGSGYVLLGKKIGGKWTSIHEGQEPPTQAVISQYNIPSSISGVSTN